MRIARLFLIALIALLLLAVGTGATAHSFEMCARLFCSAMYPRFQYPASCPLPDLLPGQTRAEWCAAHWGVPFQFR